MNGDAIYGTRSGPWKPTGSIASTRRGNTVFLHVLGAKTRRVEMPAPSARIKSATLLDGGAAVSWTLDGNRLVIELPRIVPEPLVSVVRLELDRSAMEIPAMNVPAYSSPRIGQ